LIFVQVAQFPNPAVWRNKKGIARPPTKKKEVAETATLS
jgi:hypothetical protein